MTNGETAIAEFIQLHPRLEYPSDPDKCVQQIVAQYGMPEVPIGGAGIEERYLPGSETSGKGGLDILHVPGLHAVLHASKLFDADPTALTNVTHLKHLSDEHTARYHAWGWTLLAFAEERKLDVHVELLEPVESEPLKPKWQVNPGYSDDPSPRLVAWTSENGQDLRKTVRLDAVYEADPEFLKRHIREQRAESVLGNLAARIIRHRSIHETPAAVDVPEFMREITALPIWERDEAMQDILAFLLSSVPKTEGFNRHAFRMINDFTDPDLLDRLDHMSRCQSLPAAISVNNLDLLVFTKELRDALGVVSHRPAGPENTFLARPERLIPAYADKYEQKMRDGIAKVEPMIDFLRATHDVTDITGMLEMLQEKLPDTFADYSRLHALLGRDNESPLGHGLERTIRDMAQRILRAPEGSISLKEASDQLINGFPVYLIPKDERKSAGIEIDVLSKNRITKPFLGTILMLAVCKQAEHMFQRAVETGGTVVHAVLPNHREIEADLLAGYEKEKAWRNRALEASVEEREAAIEFRAEHNISDADVEWLSQLDIPLGHTHNKLFLETIFHALLADRKGELQMNRPSFVPFLRYFLRGTDVDPDRTEARLATLFPGPYYR